MSMKKRRNELGHLSKEDYAALQDEGSDEDEPNRGEQRASEEVLSKRRILKVSSKWKTGLSVRTPSTAMPTASTPALTPTHSSMHTASASSASRNPFAATPFASTVGNIQNNGNANHGDAFKNPFASVSFAATPANKSTKASTLIATSTKKQKPSSLDTPASNDVVSKSKISSDISTSPIPPSKPLPPLRPGAIQEENIPIKSPVKGALELFFKIEKEGVVNPLSEYASILEKYMRDTPLNQSVSNGTKASSGSNMSTVGKAAAAATEGGESTSTPAAGKTVPSFDAFSTNKSNGSSSSISAPLFSFSSAPTESSGTKPFAGFSFGKTDPVAPTTLNSAPPGQIDNAEPNGDGSDGEEPTVVLAGKANEDEIDLYCCRAKYLRRIASDTDPTKKEWTNCSTGVLHVYKSKKDGKSRVVLRDAVGKVRLNLPIAKGTQFSKISATKGVGGVQFMSVMDEESDPELFMLRAKLEYFDDLCKTLENVAS